MPSPSSDALLTRIQDEYCKKCPLSLFCASGRSGGNSYWCRTCGGYYVPELDRLVQCSGFPAKRPRYKVYEGDPPLKTNHSELSCGWCCSSQFSYARILARRPPIVGFLLEQGATGRLR